MVYTGVQTNRLPSYRQRKIVIKGMLLLIGMVLFFSCFSGIRTAHAGNTPLVSTINALAMTKNAMVVDVAGEVKERFREIDNLSGPSSDADSQSPLGTIYRQIRSLTGEFSRLITSVGQLVVIVYLLLNIIQESQKGDATVEMWLRLLITMSVALFVVSNVQFIFRQVDRVGNGIYAVVSEAVATDEPGEGSPATGDSGTAPANSIDAFSLQQEIIDKKVFVALCKAYEELDSGKTPDAGTKDETDAGEPSEEEVDRYLYDSDKKVRFYDFDKLAKAAGQLSGDTSEYTYTSYATFTGAESAVLALFNLILIVTIDGMVYTLAVQMLIRRLMAPIAMADISIEGARSNGMRFLKHYLALYIQKALIFLIALFGTLVIQSILMKGYNDTRGIFQSGSQIVNNRLPVLWLAIAGMGAVTGMIMQSGNIANEIVGS